MRGTRTARSPASTRRAGKDAENPVGVETLSYRLSRLYSVLFPRRRRCIDSFTSVRSLDDICQEYSPDVAGSCVLRGLSPSANELAAPYVDRIRSVVVTSAG